MIPISPCIDTQLPVIYCGYFVEVEKVEFKREDDIAVYHLLNHDPIEVKTRGYYNARYYLNRVGKMRRDSGGVLLTRQSSQRRIYCRFAKGGLEIHQTHPLYSKLSEFPIRYLYHYSKNRWEWSQLHELAIHFFSEPKDRQYEQYILTTQEQFAAYEQCFAEVY